MPDLPLLLDHLADRAVLVVLAVLLAAAAESVIGVGAVVPGETVLVLAAVVLAGTPWLVAAVLAGWLGAWIADHVGYLLGRRLGPRMPHTRAVRSVGVDRWNRALEVVSRHSATALVAARTLPAVRTLVSAAAGAATVSYPRFAATTAVASLLWSCLWVLGGAAAGRALLAVGDWAGPAVLAVLVLLAVCVVIRPRLRRRP